MSRSMLWRRSRLQRANISPRPYRRKAVPRPKSWPSRCRRRSPVFTGRRACTGGANRRSALCVRCAGWCRCWTARLCRWSLAAFAPVIPAKGIVFCRRERWRSTGPLSTPKNWPAVRSWSAPPSASSASARRSMRRRERFPVRAGAKTSRSSTPWSILRNSRRSFSAALIASSSRCRTKCWLR